MTVKNPDREAIRHGKITEEPLRKKPAIPSWALKLGMAISGIIFGGFVLVHMVGNLKFYLPDKDGVPDINIYGEYLREMGEPLVPYSAVLWVLRIVLLLALVVHIYGAFALHARSRKSRGKFRRSNLIGGMSSFATRTMLVTGIVLLAFIIFHILDLTLGVQPVATEAFEHGEVHANMVETFSRWPVTAFYVVSMLVLFLHLSHGIMTAVSDLGITGSRTRAFFTLVAYAIPAIVMIGNIVLPVSIALGAGQ